jgi:ABC-type multidrug transport system fused ATPase/permease subunit
MRMASEEVEIGQRNLATYIRAPWQVKRRQTASDLYTSVDRGPSALVLSVVMLGATLLAEAGSALVLFVFFLILEPVTALSAGLFFGVMALLQHRLLSHGAAKAGQQVLDQGDRVYELVADINQSGKLITVMPTVGLEARVEDARRTLARARAKSAFYESFPRYLMESLLAFGFVAVGGATYILNGRDALIPALATFAVTGFRLLPTINRIQGLVLGIVGKAALAGAATTPPTNFSRLDAESQSSKDALRAGVVLKLDDVSFAYESNGAHALKNVSLELEFGKQYAIVGPSGSGKTTLGDLMLGLLEPNIGIVSAASKTSRSRVAYVAQDTHLFVGTIDENVTMQFTSVAGPDSKVRDILMRCNFPISEVLQRDDDSMRPQLSGGQRQRIGIARALYRDPELVVFDEATSALDAETEHAVMNIVSSLRGRATVVVIAHRLTTIQEADEVIYLVNGEIRGQGTFADLVLHDSDFARLVELGTFKMS